MVPLVSAHAHFSFIMVPDYLNAAPMISAIFVFILIIGAALW